MCAQESVHSFDYALALLFAFTVSDNQLLSVECHLNLF